MTREGILLVDKPKGKTSFSLVGRLRKVLGVQKIGHAGTLDPFATGVMVMLVGKNYTKQSDQFLCSDKEYIAKLLLGVATDSYDVDGRVTESSPLIPTLGDIQERLIHFNGEIEQIPPMFSAKKVEGKKLYELARQGIEIERKPVKVTVHTELLSYEYPHLSIKVAASKGTYIRSLAHDLGQQLGCFAHLIELTRTRSGHFKLEECIDGNVLYESTNEQAVESLVTDALSKKTVRLTPV